MLRVRIFAEGGFFMQRRMYMLQIKSLSIYHKKDLHALLKDFSFVLKDGEKVALIGDEGNGKSTLLKTLVGEIPALGGEFKFGQNVEWGYFDQHKAVMEKFDPEQTVLDNFWEAYPDYLREEVRSALGGFLFSGEEVEKKMGQLSGGEKVRLALCKMLQTRPNLLILDEPTNHMDIVGKDALEKMLNEYEGTVLFVSHDRYFISRVATGILEFSSEESIKGNVKQYKMSYELYLEEKERERAGLVVNNGAAGSAGGGKNAVSSAADAATAGAAAGITAGITSGAAAGAGAPTLDDVFDKKTYYNPGKVLSRLKKQLEKYEKLLAQSEEKASEYKLQLMNPELATDYPKLMEIQNKLDEEEKNQESILERMLETELELEDMQEDNRDGK